MVVTIDGPAGTGKSTVSQAAAAASQLFYLNSGRFYRAVGWKARQEGIDPDNSEAIMAVARDISIEIIGDEFLVDQQSVGSELHTPEIDRIVAPISSIPEVRSAINQRLRRFARERDVIVEGRDMSTVVFPDAEIKIYLDADPEERARRRFNQGSGVLSLEEVLKSMEERDRIDRNKPTGSLRQADEATYIDTTDLTLAEVCEKVVSIILDRKNHGRSN